MKRKVNRVGTSTLTVSLPSAWVKERNLKPGDELELDTDGPALIIGGTGGVREQTLQADVSDMGSMLNRVVAAIYKAGYHKVNLNYSNPHELETIQNAVDRSCHVFEIMKITPKQVEIRTISSLEPENFSKVFRKIGHAVLDMAEETFIALKNKDEALLKSVILKDKIVDRHTDFCRRTINAGHNTPYERPAPIYVISEQSEILADLYKSCCADWLEHRQPIHQDLLELLSAVNDLLREFYDTLYHFNQERVSRLGTKELAIRALINEISTSRRDDVKLIYYVTSMFETTFEMKSALLTAMIGELDEGYVEGE